MKVEKFNVRIVRTGDKYGLNNCLINDKEPMVEFYDSRYPHDKYGQFISRYYVSTLKRHKGGLDLYGGEPAWQVSAEGMKKVVKYLEKV